VAGLNPTTAIYISQIVQYVKEHRLGKLNITLILAYILNDFDIYQAPYVNVIKKDRSYDIHWMMNTQELTKKPSVNLLGSK
jgi:hypothetical protein